MVAIEVYSGNFCPYCIQAKALLRKKGLEFVEYNVRADPERHDEMLRRSGGARTIPQIFINNRHVGGCNELYALERGQELDAWLNDQVKTID